MEPRSRFADGSWHRDHGCRPSGLWGLLKEGMAGGWAMLKAKQDTNANPLIKAVAQDFTEGDARTLGRVVS